MARHAPNVIYFVCHDLGRELGCYGRGVDSPHIDQFAQSGMRFDQAYASSVCCSPSRGCVMTGKYAHTNGQIGLAHLGFPLPMNQTTIVDCLNEQGYQTVHTGFQHEREDARDNHYRVEYYQQKSDQYVDKAVDDAIHFLKSRESSQPFYLNVGAFEVHASAWQSRTGGARLPKYRPHMPDEPTMPPFFPNLEPLRTEQRHFQACVGYLDHHFGRLVAAIDELGLADNTLVVFTTDHGISGERAKATLYDAGTEIALIARWPGVIPGGHATDALIGNVDFAPTFLQAMGLEVPEHMQGRSFWELLQTGGSGPNEAIFMERNHHVDYDPMRSVRTSRYRYIRNAQDATDPLRPHEIRNLQPSYEGWINELWPEGHEPRPRQELYDMGRETVERTNLIDDPDYATVLAELSTKLDAWMVQTSDPLNSPLQS